MPRTWRWIVKPGTRFRSGLSAPPLCAPDRAAVLTGNYPHNTGIFGNGPGYPDLTHKRDTLPVWLERAGYRTGLVGKFLNSYGATGGSSPAPGFDRWFALDEPIHYYDYDVSDNGTTRHYGDARRDYSTDVLTREALRFLRRLSPKPWFLWLAYNAPHTSHTASPHCRALDPQPPTPSSFLHFDHLHLPRPPSFNEADVSDKPRAIASMPPLDTPHIRFLERRYRCTAAAMREVDKEVSAVMHALHRRHQLGHTIVVYVSDNGYYFGEHRIGFGKSYPYEPALRVPYVVRVPPSLQRRRARHTSDAVVSQEDLAPTILDYAGGVRPCSTRSRCRTIDGRSLRPLLGGPGRWPADRGVLAELDQGAIDYSAIRTPGYMYARYADGESELYDLAHDPFELTNVVSNPAYATARVALADRLAALRRCSGSTGRRACE